LTQPATYLSPKPKKQPKTQRKNPAQKTVNNRLHDSFQNTPKTVQLLLDNLTVFIEEGTGREIEKYPPLQRVKIGILAGS
jgi:hypothetical protein